MGRIGAVVVQGQPQQKGCFAATFASEDFDYGGTGQVVLQRVLLELAQQGMVPLYLRGIVELPSYLSLGSLVFAKELINARVRVLLGDIGGLFERFDLESGQREEEFS